jgi:hypothetical protein
MGICRRRRNENDSIIRITKPDMSQSLDSAYILLMLVVMMVVASAIASRRLCGWSGGHCVASLASVLAQLSRKSEVF